MSKLSDLRKELNRVKDNKDLFYREYELSKREANKYERFPPSWEDGEFPAQYLDEVLELLVEAGINLPANTSEIVKDFCAEKKEYWGDQAKQIYRNYEDMNSKVYDLNHNIHQERERIIQEAEGI
jgi:hypothetical protein